MAAHTLKRLKGYVGKSGRSIYECTCRNTVEAWTLVEARNIHNHELKTPHSSPTPREYEGYLYK